MHEEEHAYDQLNYSSGTKDKNIILIYYRPQRSCEGYVFTGVCLSIGGLLSQHALQVVYQHALQQVSRGCLLRGGLLPGCACSGGGLLPGGVCSGGVETPPQSRQVLLQMHSCFLFSFYNIMIILHRLVHGKTSLIRNPLVNTLLKLSIYNKEKMYLNK